MQMDLNKYTVNRKFIQDGYKNSKSGFKNVGEAISIFASSTHCPCIILAFYLAESIGFTPDLVKFIDSQIKYYGYKEIYNQMPGSPYLAMDPTNDIKGEET